MLFPDRGACFGSCVLSFLISRERGRVWASGYPLPSLKPNLQLLFPQRLIFGFVFVCSNTYLGVGNDNDQAPYRKLSCFYNRLGYASRRHIERGLRPLGFVCPPTYSHFTILNPLPTNNLGPSFKLGLFVRVLNESFRTQVGFVRTNTFKLLFSKDLRRVFHPQKCPVIIYFTIHVSAPAYTYFFDGIPPFKRLCIIGGKIPKGGFTCTTGC